MQDASRTRRPRKFRPRRRQPRSTPAPAEHADVQEQEAAAGAAAVEESAASDAVASAAPLAQTAALCETMTSSLNEGSYECRICMERVKARQRVHSCASCFAVFHMECARSWAKMQSKGWRCPNCQKVNAQKPGVYKCFCGKVRDPPLDASLPCPHSCGGACEKKLHRHCVHRCSLRCHPGPCPECHALVQRRCACRRSKLQVRCGALSDGRPPVCGRRCRRLLQCKRHTCKLECHAGKCPPCTVTETRRCFCGKKRERKPCGEGTLCKDTGDIRFSCGAVCDAPLERDVHHRCTLRCHAGPHPACARMPPQASAQLCACGKTEFGEVQRADCLEPLPTCGKTCGKRLAGCAHCCTLACHDSPCPECREEVATLCRCGAMPILLSCAAYHALMKQQQESGETPAQLLCARKCGRLLSCGKHRCTTTCCDDDKHLCTKRCDRPLNCSAHRCDAACHRGQCPPCGRPLPNGVRCSCGGSVIAGPVPCGTPAPECTLPCAARRACGHACLYTCHQGACAPCMVLSTRMCAGRHRTLTNVPCSASTPGCGQVCGRATCARHTCQRRCHAHPQAVDAVCEEPCGRLRECGHRCQQACHSDRPCPAVACDALVQTACPCGRIQKRVRCGRGAQLGDADADTVAAAGAQPLCDDECRLKQRNERLMAALSISDAQATPSSSPLAIPWTEWALETASHDLAFVQRIERSFAAFLHGPDELLYLEPMSFTRRRLVQNMSLAYGVQDELFDEGARRFLRLKRLAGSRLLPPTLLLSSVQRAFASAPHMFAVKSAAHVPDTDSLALRISGVPGNVRAHLDDLLAQWTARRDLRVRWLPTGDAVLAFASRVVMNAALHEIDAAGIPYTSVEPVASEPMLAPTKATGKATGKATLPPYHQRLRGDSWRSPAPRASGNAFSALSEKDDVADDWEAL